MDTTKVYPLDLLTDRGNRKPTALANVYNPVAAATLGFIAACLTNFAYRRPIFSGIQIHVAYSAIGGGIGYYLDGMREKHLARRDAVLRHYVELHPDDFPPVERKKYAEVLEDWVPIR